MRYDLFLYRIVPKLSTPFLHVMPPKLFITRAKIITILVRGAYFRGCLISELYGMLFVVDNLYNQNTNNTKDYVENKYLASLYQNWNEMYIISKYEKFTESGLIKFQVCITYIIILYYYTKKS